MLFIGDYYSMNVEITLEHRFLGAKEIPVQEKIYLESLKDNLWLLQVFFVKIKNRVPIHVMFYMKLVTTKTFLIKNLYDHLIIGVVAPLYNAHI